MSSTKVSTGQIADDAITTDKIIDDAVTSDKIIDGAITSAKIATGVIPAFSAVRQTVQGGPTSSGLPNFWPAATYYPAVSSLNLSTSGVSSTDPFVASASQGFGNAGERVGISTSNLTWTALTASRAAATPCYLYVDIAADGSMTTGHVIVAPVYSYTASSGTNTFNITTMTMYTTGTTKGWRVFVGEAATGVSAVTAVVMYAYNGKYSGYSSAAAPLVVTALSVTHNLGITPRAFDVFAECTTIQSTWSVGDVLSPMTWNGTYMHAPPVTASQTTLRTMASVGWYMSLPTTGATVQLTAGSWKMWLVAERGW